MCASATRVDNLPSSLKSREYESEVKENKLNFIKMTQCDAGGIDRDSRYKIKGLESYTGLTWLDQNQRQLRWRTWPCK